LRDAILEEPAAAQRLLEAAPTAFRRGDLEPDYLTFLADAFVVPLVAVRGNHGYRETCRLGTSTRHDRPPPGRRGAGPYATLRGMLAVTPDTIGRVAVTPA